MKEFLKHILSSFLAMLAHFVVLKYQPKIIMVTGSVGKTSTTKAIAAVLSSNFYLRSPTKNFNNEFGVPITIFGIQKPHLSALGYLLIIKEALALLLLPNHYPTMLVLEVGADRPGDIARILEIATPSAVVVTLLPDIPVHVEAYASPHAVREEEFMPAYALPPSAPLILASDDVHAVKMARGVSARLMTYGFGEATVSLSRIGFCDDGERVCGMKAHVHVEAEEGEVVVKGSVGAHQLLPAAAALAAAAAFGIPLPDALTALTAYEPPPGRGRILKGKNNSILIDDSYNASPAAVEEALKTLHTFPHAKRRVAVLGDMLELGRYSVAEHERIGRLASELSDVVASVGIRARTMGASQAFDDSVSAATALQDFIQEGDVILIKGSQSIRTERIVEALLADPTDISKLVRQEKEWKKRS